MPYSRDTLIFLFGITFVDADLHTNLVYAELSPEKGKALSSVSWTETKGPITSSGLLLAGSQPWGMWQRFLFVI